MLMENIIISMALAQLILVPLAYKWELNLKPVSVTGITIGLFAGLVINIIEINFNMAMIVKLPASVIIILLTFLSTLLVRFYRDPERTVPEDENAILSPADGKIIYVKKIEDGEILYSEKKGNKFPLTDFAQSDTLSSTGYVVGISMNFLDVHVNRAPIEGRICLLNHIKGLFISLKRKEALVQNERVLTVIDGGQFKVGVIQIASRLVRKIVSYIPEGQDVQRGQRIGAIRFGSQVDIILPYLPSLRIKVEPGEKVTAGTSIIATLGL